MQRFDPFRVLDERARDADLSAHRAMMAERDGGLDVDRRQVSAQIADERRAVEDSRVAWLLCVAKANEGEHYGVELELPAGMPRATQVAAASANSPGLHVPAVSQPPGGV